MKRVQNIYLYFYRVIGFIFIVGLICAILWYSLSILFFSFSNTWSVPIVLSPSQEKVIGHLTRVSAFEQELRKNKIDLNTAREEYSKKNILLQNAELLQPRLDNSILVQAKRYSDASAQLKELTKERQKNISELSALSKKNQGKKASIDKELSAGIITKHEANEQKLMLNNLNSGLIDAKAQLTDLLLNAEELSSAAKTLNGSFGNIDAINNIVRKVDLNVQIEGLRSELFKLDATIETLESVIEESDRVLQILKNSPYFLATKEATHVAFVPYDNRTNAKAGERVYSCYLRMILCYRAGTIIQVYEAEEYGKHPVFQTALKGIFLGVEFKDPDDAKKDLLFIGSRPFII